MVFSPRLAALGVRAGAQHDGAHAVIQDEFAAPAEVGEGVLMGGQQVGQALVQEALGIAAPTKPQGHDQHVDLDSHTAHGHGDLAPVDWACSPGPVSKRRWVSAATLAAERSGRTASFTVS